MRSAQEILIGSRPQNYSVLSPVAGRTAPPRRNPTSKVVAVFLFGVVFVGALNFPSTFSPSKPSVGGVGVISFEMKAERTMGASLTLGLVAFFLSASCGAAAPDLLLGEDPQRAQKVSGAQARAHDAKTHTSGF